MRPLNSINLRLWVPIALVSIGLITAVGIGRYFIVASAQRHLAGLNLRDAAIRGTRIPCFGFFDFGVNVIYFSDDRKDFAEVRLCREFLDERWTLYERNRAGMLEPRLAH